MIALRELDERRAASFLGRTSPLVLLAVALAWLLGLAVVVDPRPPLVLLGVAVAAGLALGRTSVADLLRGALPLTLAAVAITVSNTIFGAANGDPAAAELVRAGPLRVTEPALRGGIALGLRVLAIAVVGVVFALTTDPTRLVDALVRQARLPARFAYGALAAYGAIPRLADDVTALREARRVRGLRGGWHPRLLVGLLVRAIRHGDRLAIAMDARGFGEAPRTFYRELRWTFRDPLVAAGGAVALAVALLSAGP